LEGALATGEGKKSKRITECNWKGIALQETQGENRNARKNGKRKCRTGRREGTSSQGTELKENETRTFNPGSKGRKKRRNFLEFLKRI